VRELGIAFVPYSRLGGGFLSGKIKQLGDLAADGLAPARTALPGENFERNLELVRRLEDLAQRKGCTPTQLPLACGPSQGDDIVPIPGRSDVRIWRRTWPRWR